MKLKDKRGMCCIVRYSHKWKVMSDEAMKALMYASNELQYVLCFSYTCFSLSHDLYVEDTISILFGLCRRRWTTTAL